MPPGLLNPPKGKKGRGRSKLQFGGDPKNKLFTCAICGATFNRKSNLKVHQVVHTKTKEYKCDSCGKRFGLKGALTAHMKVHTDDMPYNCSICGKKFKINGNLTKHKKTHVKNISHELQVACAEAVIDRMQEQEATKFVDSLQKKLRAKKLGRKRIINGEEQPMDEHEEILPVPEQP
eukprot:m.143576 g.143576  ORF g.143576 m.143576 type:complete len:177 (-) comp30324_c0_seq1:58-588(-)